MSSEAITISADAAGLGHHGHVAHQFDDAAQQKHAGILGMWTFLATEVLFFGAIFVSYAIFRSAYHTAFTAGTHQLDRVVGLINTCVLLCSSLSMALGVHAAATSRRKALIGWLIVTMIFGTAFLGVKAYEYSTEWHHGLVPVLKWEYGADHPFTGHDGTVLAGREIDRLKLFFVFYFTMTALHALHMIVGLGVLATLVVMAWRGKFSAAYHNPVEISGLYWHFVDIVWVFLYPMLYLLLH